jgi:hypothetical protein
MTNEGAAPWPGVERDGRTVYVPVADSRLRGVIRRGSGIVGTAIPGPGRRVLIDFEGNLYGSLQMGEYEERVFHAYDRHVWKGRGYPTVARMIVEAEQLLEVGFVLTHDEPSDAEILAEARRRGYEGPMIPELSETLARELRRPEVVIDRQDLVDEWCT